MSSGSAHVPASRRPASWPRARDLFLWCCAPVGMGLLGLVAIVTQVIENGAAPWNEDAADLAFCFALGFVVGLPTAPVVGFYLRRKHLWLSLPLVYACGAGAVIGYLRLADSMFDPLPAVGPAFMAVILACLVASCVLPDARPRPAEAACASCGYDLRGTPRRRCPECGRGP